MLSFKCVTDVKLLVFPLAKMRELIEKNEDKPFGRELLILQNKYLKKNQKYPCDYIVHMPRHMMQDTNAEALYRTNCLKNVVMRIIAEIREKKKRPKLSDFIACYRGKKNEKGIDQEKVKRDFMKRFLLLYAGEFEKESVDKKYRNMMNSFKHLD